jgi:hypothetical protein
MFALIQKRLLHVIAAGALAGTAFINPLLAADGPAANLRPVGPYEPIMASVGVRRVVASFAPDFGHCAVNASVWDSIEAQADSSLRIRVSLSPVNCCISTVSKPRRSRSISSVATMPRLCR